METRDTVVLIVSWSCENFEDHVTFNVADSKGSNVQTPQTQRTQERLFFPLVLYVLISMSDRHPLKFIILVYFHV